MSKKDSEDSVSGYFNRFAKWYHHRSRDKKDEDMYKLQVGSNSCMLLSVAFAICSSGVTQEEVKMVYHQVMQLKLYLPNALESFFTDPERVKAFTLLSGTGTTASLGLGRSWWNLKHVFDRNSNGEFLDPKEKRRHRTADQKKLQFRSALTQVPMAVEGLYILAEDGGKGGGIERVLSPFSSILMSGTRWKLYYKTLKSIDEDEKLKEGKKFKPGLFLTKGPGYLTFAKGASLGVLAQYLDNHYGIVSGSLMYVVAVAQVLIGMKTLHFDGRVATAIEKSTEPVAPQKTEDAVKPQIS